MLEDTQQVYDVAYDNCISGIGTGTESPLAEQTVSGRERTSSTSWESQYLGGKLVAAADSGQQEQPGQVATPPFFCAGERCNDPRQSTTLTGPTGEQIADAGLCAADLASLGITKNAIKILGEGGERIVKIADYTSKAGTVIGVVDDVYSGRPLYTMALEFVPYGACFKIIGNLTPIKQAGGGATPPPPTNLIVSPNPVNGTVMQLEWQDHSYDELYFEVDDGNDIRMVPASSGTGTVEYTWTGLKPGSRTCFRVRVSNGDTHSNWEPNAAPSYQCAYSSRLGTAR